MPKRPAWSTCSLGLTLLALSVPLTISIGARWGAVLLLALLASVLPLRGQIWLLVISIGSNGLIRRVLAGGASWVANDPLVAFPYSVMAGIVLSVAWGERRTIVLGRTQWPLAIYLCCVIVLSPISLARNATVGALAIAGYLLPVAVAIALAITGTSIWTAALELRKAVAFVGVVVGSYGVYQYYFPPKWDLLWLISRREFLDSFGRPAARELRIWGPMESPLIFALFLGVACLAIVSLNLPVMARVGLLVPVLWPLALCGIRTVWFGLVLTALVSYVAKNVTVLRVLAVPVLAIGLLQLAPLLLKAIGLAGYSRYSVGGLSGDTSFQARLGLLSRQALGMFVPTWGGPGSTNAGATVLDNGYLAIGLELSIVGAVTVIAVLWMAWRAARLAGRRDATFMGGVILLFAFCETSAPVLQAAFSGALWIVVISAVAGSVAAEDQRRKGSSATVVPEAASI